MWTARKLWRLGIVFDSVTFNLQSQPLIYIYSHLILLIFISWSSGQIATNEGASFECLAAYSKAKGFNEPEFDVVNYDSTQEQCMKAISVFADKIRSDIFEKMAEISTDKKQTQCINAKFTSDDTFVNNIIKGEALASSDEKEKSDKLRDIEKFAEDFITSAITLCLE